MGTRLKVTCFEIAEQKWGTSPSVKVLKFRPVTSGSKENESFYSATPGGELVFSVVKLDAAAQFEVGKEYYVDIQPA